MILAPQNPYGISQFCWSISGYLNEFSGIGHDGDLVAEMSAGSFEPHFE